MWILLVPLLLLGLAWAWLAAREGRRHTGPLPFRHTRRHYERLYSRRNFLKLGGAVGGAAILAYSGVDDEVDRWHTAHVKSAATDAVADRLRWFGERFWFGYWAVFAVIDGFVHSSPVSRFGRKSFEAMVVGLPALWTVQRALGGSRPTDDAPGPRFTPLADDNTASGHAFISSIPWLVLARSTGRKPVKVGAYALSPWTGWSRINDRKHYLSQVLLGYGIAWEAVAAVMDEPAAMAPTGETSPSPASANLPV